MYESFLHFLGGIVDFPLETLGIATVAFHIQRGYVLFKHILLPRYRYCRALRKNIKIVRDSFTRIYTLHHEIIKIGQDADSLTEEILYLNIELSLPLLKMRKIINTVNIHLFSKKLYSKMVECVKTLSTQHEYILLHNQCPDNLLSPESLESMVQKVLDTLPRTFWESSTVYFKNVDLKFKCPKRAHQDLIDGLFILGQAKKSGLLPNHNPAHYFIDSIKDAYLQKDETRCKDLFSALNKMEF